MTPTDKTKRRLAKRKPPDEPAVLAPAFVAEPDEQAEILNWTPEQYHADRTCLTRGMMLDFLKSPALFRGRWIDGTIPPKPQTDAMRLGSAFHSMLFGDLKYSVWLGGRRSGKEWERFSERAAAEDRTILTTTQFDQLRGMVDAIRTDEFVAECLARADVRRELVIKWVDHGLRFKAMIDCYIGETVGAGGLVLDWKSTTDPTPDVWVPLSRRMNSHVQIAHYLDGLWHAIGSCRWIYVVVGTEPPHDVHLLEPDGNVIEVGDTMVANAVESIREFVDMPPGEPWQHAYAGRIQTYSYPGWYLREHEGTEL